MTDHRRRAEELLKHRVDDACSISCPEIKCHYHEMLEVIASALKEVEEETFARAVGCLEALMPEGSYTTEDMLVIHKRYLDALREEAAKK